MNGLAKIVVALMGIALLAGAVSAVGTAQTIKLVAKDPTTWEPIEGGAFGNLMYQNAKFTFNAHLLDPGVSYTLVSYRENWAGNEVILGTAVSNEDGDLLIKGGAIELLYYEYATETGAKIWLVPTDCMTGDDITVWAPDKFLFENSLVI